MRKKLPTNSVVFYVVWGAESELKLCQFKNLSVPRKLKIKMANLKNGL